MNVSTIAVTGAAGFVGRRLVAELVKRGHSVVGLDRAPAPAGTPQGVTWVAADLLAPESYARSLAGVETVIHMAAVTGKAKPEVFHRVNVDATKALLTAATAAGAQRFILMSSIAVTFAARQHYPYADSKIAAEKAVQAGKLAWTIVRPTMILGEGSPIQGSLERLAKLPVTPVFGDGKKKIEPVDVNDIADLLAGLVEDEGAANQVIEAGGPEAMTMLELLARLRTGMGVGGKPNFVHAPLGLIRGTLAAVEGPLLAVLPFTAGQMATFANDSVAAPHPAMTRILPQRRISPSPKPQAARA